MKIQQLSNMLGLKPFETALVKRAAEDRGLEPENLVKGLVASFLSSEGYNNPSRKALASRASLRR